MIYDLIISPAAERDIEEIMEFHGDDEEELANRFMSTLQRCFSGLETNPFNSRLIPGRGVRRYSPGKLPYHVFFRIKESKVRILAVIHTSRASDYISHRIR